MYICVIEQKRHTIIFANILDKHIVMFWTYCYYWQAKPHHMTNINYE